MVSVPELSDTVLPLEDVDGSYEELSTGADPVMVSKVDGTDVVLTELVCSPAGVVSDG